MCIGCNKLFERIARHLSESPICRSVCQQKALQEARANDDLALVGTVVTTGSPATTSDSSPHDEASPSTQDVSRLLTGTQTGQEGTHMVTLPNSNTRVRVSARNLTAAIKSKRRRTELGAPDPATVREQSFPDDSSEVTFPPSNQDDEDDDFAESDPATVSPGTSSPDHETTASNDAVMSDVPPGDLKEKPGNVTPMPLEKALDSLPHLSKEDTALVGLYKILHDAQSPQYLFNDVVSFIEKHNGTTFKVGQPLDRRKTLLKRMHDTFKLPKPEAVQVALETGTEDQVLRRQNRHDSVTVMRWDVEQVIAAFLMDANLFGYRENLVNRTTPFAKYAPSEASDKELLASQWYSDTYEEKISNPSEEFLFPLQLYVDKTGKSAALGSYCGEPLIMSSPILTLSVREHYTAWRVLGYLTDLDKSSSAKKTQQSGRKWEKGRSLRNYHSMLSAILQSLVRIQEQGGFYTWVRMADEIRYMKVIVVVTTCDGDGKSGDALCGRYGGKNCTVRVSRLCMTGFSVLDNPMCHCELVRMEHLKRLYALASDITLSKADRDRYRTALILMSQHYVDLIWFRVDFGCNPFGITLATASDLMHMFESGVLKYVLGVFIDSMTNSVRANLDDLLEKMFLPIRSTAAKDFLRTNFKGGATSLTMLNSHHWPGMAFAFLVALLTPEGRSICANCFVQENSVLLSHVDWSTAPPADGRNVYTPPILTDVIDVDAPSRQGRPYQDDDSDESDVDDDDGETDVEDEGGVVDTDEEEPDDEGQQPSNNTRKRKKALPMNCTYAQFISLLQELLTFHAWYKCGDPPLPLGTTGLVAHELQTSIRQMVHRIVTHCPRRKGNGWKVQKLHELLHVVLLLKYYLHCQNFDAGRGERLLKDFFKAPAVTSQQRGQGVFVRQVAKNMQEKMVMDKAHEAVVGASEYRKRMALNALPSAAPDDGHPTVEGGVAFKVRYHSTTRSCSFEWRLKNKTTQVHPVLLSHLGKKWDQTVGSTLVSELECYTEIKLSDGQAFRAHPNYMSAGPWYDWALVRLNTVRSNTTTVIPCRVVCFFRKPPSEDVGITSGLMAIVQACSPHQRLGTLQERKDNHYHTHLCSRWELAKSGLTPRLHSVPVESLEENIVVVEEEPGLCESWQGGRYVWAVQDRRGTWSKLFPLP